MAYPSHVARGALRHALRTHPDRNSVLNGILVNNLSLDDLKAALTKLGVDPAQLVMNAGNGQTVIEPDETKDTAPMPVAPVAPVAPAMPSITLDTAAIETEVQSIRSLIMTGGFATLDDKLRALVTEARKPAVTVEVIREVQVPVDVIPGARPIHCAKPSGTNDTWRDLFGVTGTMGKRTTAVWDATHPDTPKVNDRYLWPHPQTETALSQLARGRNVMLYGDKGTGKTEWAQQLAARTGRPFALISCDTSTDASTLVGMTVPSADGGVTWQDGQLTRAIQTPGCVICLDEPSVARPGALFVFQNVLANRQLFIAETGRRVNVASGVLFIATDNTNGTGGGARRGYTDTNRLNTAFLDRFGVRVKVTYLPADREAEVICSYTGCPPELATLLVCAATVTRAASDNQQLSEGIGLRRLLAWSELLQDGVDAEYAFQSAVLNCAAEQDVETLREQCLLAYDQGNVTRALKGSNRTSGTTTPATPDPSATNPTPAGRAAAASFPSV